MYNIATVSTINGHKTYMVDSEGKKMEWNSLGLANSQITLFKMTAGYGDREPKNFKYVIEPATLKNENAKLNAELKTSRIIQNNLVNNLRAIATISLN